MMIVQPTRVVGSSDNLLIDGNFENWTNSTTLTNWTWVNWGDNNITQETIMVLSGNSSVNLTRGSNFNSLHPDQTVNVELNKNYTFSVWVYDNNPNASVRISLETSSTPFIYDSDDSVDTASWQQLSATVDNSGGQTYASITISIQDQGSTPGGSCYIDAAALIEGNSPLGITPQITIINPSNSTQSPPNTWLNFSIDVPTSWIGYSLDGAPNVTITGNTILYSLSGGSHMVKIYANVVV